MSLILLARASELIPNFSTSDNGVLSDILDATSALIERYCNRTFALTNYDERVNGNGYPNLLLDNYPITKIDKVQGVPANAIQIQNTLTNSLSSAIIRLDSTSLYLTTVASGVTTTRTLTRASYLTLNDLATAINTYSSDGWHASALGPYATWPVSELYSPQGGFDGRFGGALYFKLMSYPLFDFQFNGNTGELQFPASTLPGALNYRVVYTAGFSSIPEPIQQACAELTVATWNARGMNANLISESLGSYSYTQVAEKSFASLSAVSRQALELYRNRRIRLFRMP